MAITTLDGVAAGLTQPVNIFKLGTSSEGNPIHHSLFYNNYDPPAAAVPTPGMAGAALTTYAGQLRFSNPSSGNTYLAGFECCSSQIGAVVVADRLWHNSGIVVTTTTAQTVNSVAWPARDRTGTTDGDDVMVAIEVSTTTTNGADITNMTLQYTNSAGTAGRTGTATSSSLNFPATATAGTFVQFCLDAGDTGVRSIQSITLGTSLVTGVVRLVAYRVLTRLETPVYYLWNRSDVVSTGFVRCYDDTVPFLFYNAGGTAGALLLGTLTFAQG